MSCAVHVSDSRIPETVVIRVDPLARLADTTRLTERIAAILPELNWRTHFFVVCERAPGVMDMLRPIVDGLARFALANALVTYYVHPVVPIGSPHGATPAQWRELLDSTRPFEEQAYEQQSEARLVLLPIIEPSCEEVEASWMRTAEHLRGRLAKPSVLLRGPGAVARARAAANSEIRCYLAPDVASGAAGAIEQLWANLAFEDLLERVKAANGSLATGRAAPLESPCRAHLVIDQASGEVFACFDEWKSGRPLGSLDDAPALAAAMAEQRSPAPCADCLSRSLCCMTDSLIANDRRREGGRVHQELARAFSERKQYDRAIEHASMAGDFADRDADRAVALVCMGLCHLARRELPSAEAALAQAASVAEDPGLVAFHRGRVQFEWRDYIEALDRFEEALASGSPAVPAGELFFYMAVSHITIGEYPEARPYLERWQETGWRRSVMLYYRGLCDAGENDFESALSALRAAEEAGPAEEDLGRVMFYIGFCLKELGRHAEAIAPLERAAAVDSGEIAVFNLLGFCCYKTSRHTEAVRCFERAIEIDPRSAIDFANLATNLRELGRREEAIANYRRALALDRSIGFARENLKKLLA